MFYLLHKNDEGIEYIAGKMMKIMKTCVSQFTIGFFGRRFNPCFDSYINDVHSVTLEMYSCRISFPLSLLKVCGKLSVFSDWKTPFIKLVASFKNCNMVFKLVDAFDIELCALILKSSDIEFWISWVLLGAFDFRI